MVVVMLAPMRSISLRSSSSWGYVLGLSSPVMSKERCSICTMALSTDTTDPMSTIVGASSSCPSSRLSISLIATRVLLPSNSSSLLRTSPFAALATFSTTSLTCPTGSTTPCSLSCLTSEIALCARSTSRTSSRGARSLSASLPMLVRAHFAMARLSTIQSKALWVPDTSLSSGSTGSAPDESSSASRRAAASAAAFCASRASWAEVSPLALPYHFSHLEPADLSSSVPSTANCTSSCSFTSAPFSLAVIPNSDTVATLPPLLLKTGVRRRLGTGARGTKADTA
mmetsp:Transcript_13760/g.31861  ORF Transcript_13760/g.31861 Transcript_13760/m.31861 type:complete len:284 (-) Transcript_13760:112-963(-)